MLSSTPGTARLVLLPLFSLHTKREAVASEIKRLNVDKKKKCIAPDCYWSFVSHLVSFVNPIQVSTVVV